jgi:long-chain acyl-CoA synthetase
MHRPRCRLHDQLPESGDTVMTDLREIGPTYYFAPPRVFENLLTTVMIRMEDAGALKRGMFHYFMSVAKRCGADILDGKPRFQARIACFTRWATC